MSLEISRGPDRGYFGVTLFTAGALRSLGDQNHVVLSSFLVGVLFALAFGVAKPVRYRSWGRLRADMAEVNYDSSESWASMLGAKVSTAVTQRAGAAVAPTSHAQPWSLL